MNGPRARSQAILGAALAAGLAGAALAAPAGAPPVYPGAEVWETLASTRITVDDRSGVYQAAHPDAVKNLQGKAFTLSGWMMPIDSAAAPTHFILTRYPVSCPFCDPANPNEVVEVFSARPIKYSPGQVVITGQFSIQNKEEAGLFFRLDKAEAKAG